MRLTRGLLLLTLLATVLGCGHFGRFVHKRQFHVETINFRADGTFVFTCWFDDGGGTTEVAGTWRSGDGKKTAVSTVPGLEPTERSPCVHLRGEESWEYRLSGWHRGAEGPFKRDGS